MFEVKKPESSSKTFRLPDDLIEELERVAAEKGVSMNQVVIQCCRYALENMDHNK